MNAIRGEGKLIRIFVGEADRFRGRPFFEGVVLAAREMGLGGATVLRGVQGFGANSVLHTSRLLRLSEDLPVVVEIVEMAERIEPFVRHVESMFDEAGCGGLVTLERAEVIRYSATRRKG